MTLLQNSSPIMNLLKKRAEHNFSYVRPFIEGDSILDIGAAEGWTGEMIKKSGKDRDVQLLDVDDFNQTSLPLTLYDGQTFPFKDNQFDTCLLLLILHHCDGPFRVLSEAARVTRKRLIITESVYNFILGKALLFMCDNMVNALRTNGKMAYGLKFLKTRVWESQFSKMGASITHKKWISTSSGSNP